MTERGLIMKKYENPDCEIILFNDMEIITSSKEQGEFQDPSEWESETAE